MSRAKTSPVELRLIREGRRAYHAGESAAPALNAQVMEAIGDRPVGDPHTRALMSAFTFGYEAERERELAQLLAEEDDPR